MPRTPLSKGLFSPIVPGPGTAGPIRHSRRLPIETSYHLHNLLIVNYYKWWSICSQAHQNSLHRHGFSDRSRRTLRDHKTIKNLFLVSFVCFVVKYLFCFLRVAGRSIRVRNSRMSGVMEILFDCCDCFGHFYVPQTDGQKIGGGSSTL